MLAGLIAGGIWGFIPGFLKAVSGAHEVVSTIMMNYVAVQLLAALVSGPLKVPRSPSPVTFDVGNAAFPIILARERAPGDPARAARRALRVVAPVPDDLGLRGSRPSGANPDAARYAGMRPKLITVATMTFSGSAGRPGRHVASCWVSPTR